MARLIKRGPRPGSRPWLLLSPTKTRGQRIRFLRIAYGLTGRDLAIAAAKAGGHEEELTKSFISLLESDRTEPSVKTLRGLAQVLGVSMDYLETGRAATEGVPIIEVAVRSEGTQVIIEVVRPGKNGHPEKVERVLNRDAVARLIGRRE